MKKILPILLAAAITTSSAFLTPLYPVYAQSNLMQKMPQRNATGAADLTPGIPPVLDNALGRVKNATAEAKLKQALARFKDKNKAQRLELINTNLNDINARRTQNMTEALQKISDILTRVKSKASAAASDDVNSAIAEVESQWAEADAAVKAQAAKDYSIVLNTESTAASDAAAAKNALQSDLQSTHAQVAEARQALRNAISSLLSSIGGTNGSN